MEKLNSSKLEEVMAEAGIPEEEREKLRSVNKAKAKTSDKTDKASPPAPPARPQGHGAATQAKPMIDDL